MPEKTGSALPGDRTAVTEGSPQECKRKWPFFGTFGGFAQNLSKSAFWGSGGPGVRRDGSAMGGQGRAPCARMRARPAQVRWRQVR